MEEEVDWFYESNILKCKIKDRFSSSPLLNVNDGEKEEIFDMNAFDAIDISRIDEYNICRICFACISQAEDNNVQQGEFEGNLHFILGKIWCLFKVNRNKVQPKSRCVMWITVLSLIHKILIDQTEQKKSTSNNEKWGKKTKTKKMQCYYNWIFLVDKKLVESKAIDIVSTSSMLSSTWMNEKPFNKWTIYDLWSEIRYVISSISTKEYSDDYLKVCSVFSLLCANFACSYYADYTLLNVKTFARKITPSLNDNGKEFICVNETFLQYFDALLANLLIRIENAERIKRLSTSELSKNLQLKMNILLHGSKNEIMDNKREEGEEEEVELHRGKSRIPLSTIIHEGNEILTTPITIDDNIFVTVISIIQSTCLSMSGGEIRKQFKNKVFDLFLLPGDRFFYKIKTGNDPKKKSAQTIMAVMTPTKFNNFAQEIFSLDADITKKYLELIASKRKRVKQESDLFCIIALDYFLASIVTSFSLFSFVRDLDDVEDMNDDLFFSFFFLPSSPPPHSVVDGKDPYLVKTFGRFGVCYEDSYYFCNDIISAILFWMLCYSCNKNDIPTAATACRNSTMTQIDNDFAMIQFERKMKMWCILKGICTDRVPDIPKMIKQMESLFIIQDDIDKESEWLPLTKRDHIISESDGKNAVSMEEDLFF